MDWMKVAQDLMPWAISGIGVGIIRLLFAIQKLQGCVQRLNWKMDLTAQWQEQHGKADDQRFEHLREMLEANKGG